MFCENLAGNILSHIYNDTTPFLFLPKRCGLEYPLKWNCETGKVSSSLISVMIKISNIPFTRTFSSVNFLVKESMLALFRMGFFGAAHGWGGGAKRPPSLKSVTHILQWWNLAQLCLTQGRSEKYMNHVTHSLCSADISFFSPEITKFCYIKKHRYRLYFDT